MVVRPWAKSKGRDRKRLTGNQVRRARNDNGRSAPAREAHQPIETDHEPQVVQPDIWAGGDARIPQNTQERPDPCSTLGSVVSGSKGLLRRVPRSLGVPKKEKRAGEKMEEREQKIVLERFLTHHNVEMLPWARPAQFGRRFRRFFPDIADHVNPDRKPWHAAMINALAEHVANLDPSNFVKDDSARPFHVAKKYRKLDRTKTFLLGWQWRQLRYEVLKDRGARCELCGATAADSRIEVDHIKPISKHWDLRLMKSNLQVLCRDCNMGKGNRYADDFRGV